MLLNKNILKILKQRNLSKIGMRKIINRCKIKFLNHKYSIIRCKIYLKTVVVFKNKVFMSNHLSQFQFWNQSKTKLINYKI